MQTGVSHVSATYMLLASQPATSCAALMTRDAATMSSACLAPQTACREQGCVAMQASRDSTLPDRLQEPMLQVTNTGAPVDLLQPRHPSIAAASSAAATATATAAACRLLLAGLHYTLLQQLQDCLLMLWLP